jgi:hypothetical protein
MRTKCRALIIATGSLALLAMAPEYADDARPGACLGGEYGIPGPVTARPLKGVWLRVALGLSFLPKPPTDESRAVFQPDLTALLRMWTFTVAVALWAALAGAVAAFVVMAAALMAGAALERTRQAPPRARGAPGRVVDEPQGSEEPTALALRLTACRGFRPAPPGGA